MTMRFALPIIFTLILMISWDAPLRAGWNFESCDTSHQARWSSHERAVRAATLHDDSPVYVLHPYPTRAQEMAENFVDYWRWLHDRLGEEIPVSDRRLVEAIEGGDAELIFRRLENWTGTRCGVDLQRDHHYLVQVFTAQKPRQELGRIFVREDGHWVTHSTNPLVGAIPPEFLTPLLGLDKAPGLIRERWGLEATELQYVNAWGTVRCPDTSPCLAFREVETGAPHLLHLVSKRLYEILEHATLHPPEATDPRFSSGFLQVISGRGHELVSAGQAGWLEMREVPPVGDQAPK